MQERQTQGDITIVEKERRVIKLFSLMGCSRNVGSRQSI